MFPLLMQAFFLLMMSLTICAELMMLLRRRFDFIHPHSQLGEICLGKLRGGRSQRQRQRQRRERRALVKGKPAALVPNQNERGGAKVPPLGLRW